MIGCGPILSKETLKTADRNVRFEDILKNPEAYKDTTVVLGGSIVRVENLENRTLVEVIQHRLNSQLKPINPDESAGRFFVEFDDFKDPAIYSPGRFLTVAGKVRGVEKRKLGKMDYDSPVIAPVEHYLWRQRGYEGEPSIGIGLGVFHSF